MPKAPFARRLGTGRSLPKPQRKPSAPKPQPAPQPVVAPPPPADDSTSYASQF